MKILLIDSHKGSTAEPAQNLHWLNAERLKNHLESIGHDVNFIWSYPTVNDNITTGYDRIIFNHTSRYSYISDEWITKNADAKMFYITNEYNLGEPLLLWSLVKNGLIKYDVIANHPDAASKVVRKYVNDWHIVNLNALIIQPEPYEDQHSFFVTERKNCVYYGSFRKDRQQYFKKYLSDGKILISTHVKNRNKFKQLGITGPFIDRINWEGKGLSAFKTSLYMEDETTHTHYNFLANRFYEALNYNTFPLFDKSCIGSFTKSGYFKLPDYAIVDNVADVEYITEALPDTHTAYLDRWRKEALYEKRLVLDEITKLVTS